MTYYSGKQLAASYRTVRGNTITAAREIPEDKYSFRATPDTRSVAEQLVHIAMTSRIQEEVQQVQRATTLNGFNFPALIGEIIAEEKKPRTKDEILALLQTRGDAFAAWLETLSEDFLAEQVEMPAGATPATKSRFEMILSAKEHEMHHRAQLMLVQRMLGLVPHGTRAMQERLAQMQKQAEATKA